MADEMTLVCVLETQDILENMSLELWREPSGRLVLRAYNQCGYCHVDVAVLDLLAEVTPLLDKLA